ncbi:cadherin repeat domain-containing protein, partial [Bathymodiolus thermophilus thioautotrophic gill symbiont]|uniref:cadherin repeat domain-containing protein n=1 Tax=Bathymodiolus thermophilus thioautotrophic gill symbiont TaxID=2360 RepID=UPI00192ACC9D
MNTFNRFIITTLLVLFASQAFATQPTVTKIERTNVTTITVTYDQGIKPSPDPRDPIDGQLYIRLYVGTTYYLGSPNEHINRTPTPVNPNDNGFATQWQWEESTLTTIDNDRLNEITINLNSSYSDFASSDGTTPQNYYINTFSLIWQHGLTITSTNTFPANEKAASTTHTLVANDTAATFSITEDTSRLFSLSGTNNNTLTFNGTNTNYESTTKSYTVKVKATTGDGDDKNTTQTITVTLNDLNDETPTAITLTGNRTIAENTNTGTELGTLSATDADANDTFTYTSSNTKFTISNDKLKLNATLDYENATSLNTTITVTDANSHTFDKTFNFTVSDIDDTAPTNILLSNVNLIKGQPANTLVGTLSASDVDTNTPLTFTVNDTTNFKIVNGNELRTNRSTTALGNTININITASDNTNDSAPQPFTIAITTTYIAAPV